MIWWHAETRLPCDVKKRGATRGILEPPGHPMLNRNVHWRVNKQANWHKIPILTLTLHEKSQRDHSDIPDSALLKEDSAY